MEPSQPLETPTTTQAAPPPAKKPRKAPSYIDRTLLVDDAAKTQFKIKLQIPEPTEECPVTLSLMANDELPFLPGQTFSKMFRNFTKMTLPCTHSFGAMTMLYHFARNNMRCPLCREGHEERLDTRSIPSHIRKPIVNRIKESDRVQNAESMAEDEAEDEAVARRIITRFFQDFGRYVTNMYLLVSSLMGNEILPLFEFRVDLLFRGEHEDQDVVYYAINPRDRRTILSNLRDLNINDICLALLLNDHGTRHQVATSVFFPVTEPGHQHVLCDQGEITTMIAEENAVEERYMHVVWRIPIRSVLNAVVE